MVDINVIGQQVDAWSAQFMPADYRFRKYQKESICAVIFNVLNNNKSIDVLEAVTGAGKSLICLIAAGVLAAYYNKTCYILVSDLYLWQQYEDAILKYNLPYGRLKGSLGNYVCDDNGKDLRYSTCKLKSVPFSKLYDREWCNNNDFSCSSSCEYIQSRIYAQKSKVTLMTYQLWLGHMHNPEMDTGFGIRDVVFCDECHNVPNIVQNWCSPAINKVKDHMIYNKLFSSLRKSGYLNDFADELEFIAPINDIFDHLLHELEDVDTYASLKEYVERIDVLTEPFNQYKFRTGRKFFMNHEVFKVLSLGLQLGNILDFLKTYIQTIDMSGEDYLIKQVVYDDKGNREIKLQCAKEDLLVYNYMMCKSEHYVMLSATVGNLESFKESIGYSNMTDSVLYFHRIPSTFDFSSSPIIYMKDFNMNYDHIDASIPNVANTIANIVNNPMFIDKKGIIHSGSYLNSQKIFACLPQDVRNRILYYKDSKEKEVMLQEYQMSENKILMGPTLTEGIDLKDDLCRFLIIAKVPFPQLKDLLVQAKKELYPSWYKSTTNKSIIQAIGRGNRHPSDWCWSFILDSAFDRLLKDEVFNPACQYPPEFLNRLYELKNGQYFKVF